jgi:hypothetical protein
MEESSQGLNEIIQIKVGKISFEVKPGFNASFLGDVIRTLKSLC